jgi:hypothetical protein
MTRRKHMEANSADDRSWMWSLRWAALSHTCCGVVRNCCYELSSPRKTPFELPAALPAGPRRFRTIEVYPKDLWALHSEAVVFDFVQPLRVSRMSCEVGRA